jgi:hypothetical protein
VNYAKIELTGNNTRNINPKEQCENKTYREQKNKYKSQETDKEITRSTDHKEQGIMQKIPHFKFYFCIVLCKFYFCIVPCDQYFLHCSL